MRHKHADLIHAWAEGAEVQLKNNKGEWVDAYYHQPAWIPQYEYRIKPEEPNWWENIPEHGILIKSKVTGRVCWTLDGLFPEDWEPLTNEEIERFKR